MQASLQTSLLSSVPAPTDLGIERILRGSRLFGGLEPRLLGAVARASRRKQLTRGEAIWRTGQEASHFTLVHAGLVKVVRRCADGGDCLIGLFGPRESVGDLPVIERTAYLGNAIAATERVEVVRVEAAPVLALAVTEAGAAQALIRALLQHAHALEEKIDVLSAGSVPQRLAMLLIALGDRFGDELEEGELTVPLALSRGELSCMVGARVETTIRILTKWQREGTLSTTKDGIVLHRPERLRDVVSGK